MNYECRVNVIKEFNINFPDELFTEEHMEAIRSFSEYYRNVTVEELKKEIMEAYAIGGDGYYEQFGCYIGWNEFTAEGYGRLFVKVWNEDADIDDSYMEEI